LSKIFYLGLLLAAVLVVGLGCAGNPALDREAATWPADVRADYAVFAQRCSKCHSLARPLQSGIDNDDYWRLYVERMRRQPGSGISVADTVPILRFLHVYSLEVKKRKGENGGEPEPAAPAPSDLPPPSTPIPVSSAEVAPVSSGSGVVP